MSSTEPIRQLYVEGHNVELGHIVSRRLEDPPPVRHYRIDLRKVRAIVDRFNRRQIYRALNEHHKVLTLGVGKCSHPSLDVHGRPVGFCDVRAFGRQVPILPDVYCAGLACPTHGGPTEWEAHGFSRPASRVAHE